MKKFILKNESGFASVIALIMVGMLTLLGLAALNNSDDELSIASNDLQEMKAFYSAEAGMEIAAAAILTSYDQTNMPPSSLPDDSISMNNCRVSYKVEDDGPAEQKVMDNGNLAGLFATVKSFSIVARARNSVDETEVELTQTFETANIPIYQFALFYNYDLELSPGADMSFLGRVHANGNMYMQTSTNINADSYLTSSKNIRHGVHPNAGISDESGSINIKNTTGSYVDMELGSGSWVDADYGKWYDSSVSMWQGRVQDSTHGQGELMVPMNGGVDPHKMIEPATGGNSDSYEDLSSLKFINQKAYQLVGGIWTDVTADMQSKAIISFADDQFYDAREGLDADIMELDMGNLYDSGYAPDNGVIYYSDQNGSRDFPALRLHNADTLGAPITIASENPVYTKGDYNTLGKVPASILADAVTFLSDSWDDTKSGGPLAQRGAINTTVNVSFITGNVPSESGNYSGGFENLPRFLEKWAGKTFTWSGSGICLWDSEQADQLWSSVYFDDPIRNWTFDMDLDDVINHPPETPIVRIYQRTGWKQSYVAY